MTALDQRLDNITQEVQRLVAQNRELKAMVATLESANRQLTLQLAKEQAQHQEMASTQGNHSEIEAKKARQLRQQLDQYIQDIDRCIDWLEKF